eukprot:TRINITY_DN13092_c0_g2_i6.p1 TRINITY_DN13092_c0_g2~~TRINITY_DN13092_c0_g2_i6.p1  ORF type:complete len:527 (+),score=85.45 TRINITY_DN13092_c0_g2_i6:55-1581(+)
MSLWNLPILTQASSQSSHVCGQRVYREFFTPALNHRLPGLPSTWPRFQHVVTFASFMGSVRYSRRAKGGHSTAFASAQSLSPKVGPRLAGLPNLLTFLRVLAIGPLVVLFYAKWAWAPIGCASVFAAAAITDWLDGYLARRWRVSSAFGAFLDPVADKLMVGAAVVLLPTAVPVATEGATLWSSILLSLPAVLLTLREILVSALREWMASYGKRDAVKVGWLGKCKTALLMISLSGLLATSRSGFSSITFRCCLCLLHVSTIFAVISAGQYLASAWPLLEEGWKSSARPTTEESNSKKVSQKSPIERLLGGQLVPSLPSRWASRKKKSTKKKSTSTASANDDRVVWTDTFDKVEEAADRGDVATAEQLYCRIKSHVSPEQRLMFHTVVIKACANAGDSFAARRWFESLLAEGDWLDFASAEVWFHKAVHAGMQPDITSYNLMLDAACNDANLAKAEEWFQNAIDDDQDPNTVSYDSVMNAAARSANFAKAEEWWSRRKLYLQMLEAPM